MSSTTGPGRPVDAMWKARAMASGMSSARRTWQLHFVTGWVMPITSVSWKASVPKPLLPTCPVITTSGVLSMRASVMPVIMLVAPGPDVTIATPVRPVTRA